MKIYAQFIARSKVGLLIFLALVAATTALSLLAAVYPTFPADHEALDRFQDLESSGLSGAFRFVTHLGTWVVAFPSILLVALALWAFGKRRLSLLSLLMPLVEWLGFAVKAWVGRPRPQLALFPPGPSSESFPSGHAIHAVLFFGFLIYLSSVYMAPSKLRVIIQMMLLLIILAVGASRVYLGLHWSSDVIGGYLFGGVFLLPLLWLAKVGKTGGSTTG